MWFWLFLFIMGCVLDLMYIAWMWAAEKRMAWLAGFSSLAIYAMGIFGTIEVIEDKVNCIPLFAGVFAGSYIGVKITKRLDTRKKGDKIQA